MIYFNADIRSAHARSDDSITSGSVGIPVALALDSAFNGLAKTLCFKTATASVDIALVGDATESAVPPDVISTAGEWLYIGIYAADGDGDIVIPTVWANVGKIEQGTIPSGVDPSEPTPSWVAQVQNIASEALETANSVREDADSGKFDGEPGEAGANGTTFIPNVDAAGNISWTNNGDLPNPEQRNIMGPKGDTFTYADLTDADKADLVQGPIAEAQTAAVNAVNSAGTSNVSAVNSAGTTQVSNVNQAGDTQAAAVEQKGEEALAELQEYADLPEDVADLKSAISDISNISYTKYPGYISSSGSISQPSSNNEVYTSKISAIAGQSFAFSFRSSTTNLGNWCAYALYDENDNFISRTVFISNVLSNEVFQIVTIPQTLQNSTARYISFTWRNFNDGEETISVSNLNSVLSQVKSECIAPLILSQAKNYVDITITDTASSINFPADVLACTNAGYVQITTTETEIDISSSAIATTAIKVVYNLSTKQFGLCAYNIPLSPQQILIASIRRHVANPSIFIGCNYALNGKPFGIDFVNGHAHVLSINHRGYYTAPENTLPAYILSKQKGFDYVECDVAFTSDGVPVLLHDATINRTARNADGSAISQEININDITYEQALQYDFGIYKSDSYAGTKIPTLAQFIGLCKNLGLYPYIELKDTATYSEAQISGLIDIVRSYGMLRDVTWISFNSTYLGYVKNADSEARLGLVCGDITQTIIDGAVALKTSSNDVFIDAYYSNPEHQPWNIPRCISAGIPVEVWTVDTTTAITGMNPYITGVSSNRLVASSVLYSSAIE